MGAPNKDPKGLGVSWVILSKPRWSRVIGNYICSRRIWLGQSSPLGAFPSSEQLKLFPEELF